MRLSQKFALAVFISMIILAVCMLCFAEEEWKGYRVGDVYMLENGENSIVTEVMADGVRCSTKLYKQRKQEEAEEIKYKDLYDGLVEERQKDEAKREIEKQKEEIGIQLEKLRHSYWQGGFQSGYEEGYKDGRTR